MHAMLFISASIALAPAPVYKPALTKEMAALCEEGDRCMAEARRLTMEFDPADTPGRRAEIGKERNRLMRQAAIQYGRAFAMLEKGRGGGATSREADQVGIKSARAWLNVGDSDKAVKIYDTVAARSLDAETLVDALSGSLIGYDSLGGHDKVDERVKKLRRVVEKLPDDKRDKWQEWLQSVERQKRPR